MKKKVSNRSWGIIVFISAVMYGVGVGAIIVFRDDIIWLIMSCIFCFGIGSWWLLHFFTKKGRMAFFRCFACYYISDTELYQGVGKTVFFSIHKDQITKIALGKIENYHPRAKKPIRMIVIFAKSGKIAAEIEYTKKGEKYLVEWLAMPMEIYDKPLLIFPPKEK